MTIFDQNHPPKNRTATGLGIIEIQVVDVATTHSFQPNTLIMAIIDGRFELGEPIAPSLISHEPGYLYRTDDVEVPLTRDEIIRLAGSELEPSEFICLRNQFGVFFEIHDDFYDPETGEAWQPKGLSAAAGARPQN